MWAGGGLHHVELQATDLERALREWGWLLPELGHALRQRWSGGASIWRAAAGHGWCRLSDARYRWQPDGHAESAFLESGERVKVELVVTGHLAESRHLSVVVRRDWRDAASTGESVYNPMRVLAHPLGAEVVFMLRRAEGVTADAFEADCAAVTSDLERLRTVSEA